MQDNSRTRFPEEISIIGAKRETARQEFAARKKILDLLRSGPLTVPEVARALGISTTEANWWLMGFWRYNKVKAGEKADDEGYYRYSLVEGQ
ncbi:MAG TPA: MarR family transcriptional regulator [Patescibacteria group bacterium]|nr:MarR family transcriptional regulator [Patescibacteria group bacterium]